MKKDNAKDQKKSHKAPTSSAKTDSTAKEAPKTETKAAPANDKSVGKKSSK